MNKQGLNFSMPLAGIKTMAALRPGWSGIKGWQGLFTALLLACCVFNACAAGAFTSDVRYSVLDNKTTGTSIAVLAWKPDDVSVYCDEKEFKKYASVLVVKIEPKAREQKMETISASDMSKSLDATGKVAIYGILFLVKDYGLGKERLTANGVASLAPVQSNADEAGRSKNRRVELVLQ